MVKKDLWQNFDKNKMPIGKANFNEKNNKTNENFL